MDREEIMRRILEVAAQLPPEVVAQIIAQKKTASGWSPEAVGVEHPHKSQGDSLPL